MDAARAVEAKMRLAKTDIERKEGKRPSSHKAGAGATMNSDLCHKLWNIISLPFFHGSACLFPTRFTTKQRTSHTKTSASHPFQKKRFFEYFGDMLKNIGEWALHIMLCRFSTPCSQLTWYAYEPIFIRYQPRTRTYIFLEVTPGRR